MKAVGAGRAVPVAFTLLLALAAKGPPVRAHGDAVTSLRFERDIRPILARACVTCHRAGGPAPMPLETYEDVRPWATAIKEEILERRMPPWPAMRGFGDIRNAPAFGDRDVQRIVDWVLGGSPRGQPVAVADQAPPEAARSHYPETEVVFRRRAAPATTDGVVWYEADVPAARPSWLMRLAWSHPAEAGRPASVYLESPPRGGRGARPQWIGSSSFGRDAVELPELAGVRLEPGSRLLLALAVGPGDAPIPSGVSARLAWTAERSVLEVQPLAIPMIPSHTGYETGRVHLETDAWVIGVRPAVGRDISAAWVSAYPTGRPPQVLVFTRAGRGPGPDGFSLERAVYLARGTEIVATVHAGQTASGPTDPASDAGVLLIEARRGERGSVAPRWAPVGSEARIEARGFSCPMHPQVYREGAGTCPLCGMELIEAPTATRDFELELEARHLDPGQQGEISVRVRDPRNGEVVRSFQALHERPLHLFIVSQDLTYFEHAHPVPGPDGTFTLETRLPASGLYRVFADLFPAGDAPQLLSGHLLTSGSAPLLDARPTSKAAEETRQTQQGRTDVELTTEPAQPIAGRPIEVAVTLRDSSTGAALTDLRPYLGTLAHVVIVSEDLEECIHTHPREASPDAAARPSGTRLSFGTLLPRPGLYRIWAQFLRGQELVTAAFTIRAAPLT